MPRPTIHCPQCHREIFNLRRPLCLWCGANIPHEQFEQVAALPTAVGPQEPMPLFLPPPVYGAVPFGLGAWRRLNPFRSINSSVSPCERKLRIAGAVLALCFIAARLAEVLWRLWQLHQAVPLAPHLR